MFGIGIIAGVAGVIATIMIGTTIYDAVAAHKSEKEMKERAKMEAEAELFANKVAEKIKNTYKDYEEYEEIRNRYR